MPGYKVLVPLSGCINGVEWPAVGEVIDVDADLSGMVEVGHLAVVGATAKVEKRPAVDKAEKRTSK
jgi:hypothetical protein